MLCIMVVRSNDLEKKVGIEKICINNQKLSLNPCVCYEWWYNNNNNT